MPRESGELEMKLSAALVLVLLILGAPAAADDTVKPVKLMEVRTTTGGITRQFFGQVVARQTVDLAFQVAGQIVEFPVIEGQTIPEGTLVARLDLEPFQLARDQARLQKEQADRTVDRLNRLSGSSVSQVAIDDAATQAGLAGIAVRNAENALADATLLAPFDALVATRNVANFTTVAAGTPVVRLYDMSELRIEIDVPEILFQRAGDDQDVEVSAKFPASERVYPLEVREFNAEASAIGQTFRLTFALPERDGLHVLPGSSVTVSATINTGPPVLAVPASALAPDAGGAVSVLVFAPTEGDLGRLERRLVQVSVAGDGGFQVTGGLRDGEEIVVAGVAALEDGQTVRRFRGFAD